MNEQIELHGKGTMETDGYPTEKDRTKFQGVFNHNIRQGFGSIERRDADDKVILHYEGLFEKNQPNGNGVLTMPFDSVP